MKTIHLLLCQPVTFVIQLVRFNVCILQKKGNSDIRGVNSQILNVVFDDAAVIERGVVRYIFRQPFLSGRMSI
jgi:hypothetical protein